MYNSLPRSCRHGPSVPSDEPGSSGSTFVCCGDKQHTLGRFGLLIESSFARELMRHFVQAEWQTKELL